MSLSPEEGTFSPVSSSQSKEISSSAFCCTSKEDLTRLQRQIFHCVHPPALIHPYYSHSNVLPEINN